jgi:hypothetical protein
MKLSMLFLAAAFALVAGCDRDPQPRTSQTPGTASGGAATGATSTGPKGDGVPLPPSSQAGASKADTKPDPGDANDHSNPQHDAKSKRNRD